MDKVKLPSWFWDIKYIQDIIDIERDMREKKGKMGRGGRDRYIESHPPSQ